MRSGPWKLHLAKRQTLQPGGATSARPTMSPPPTPTSFVGWKDSPPRGATDLGAWIARTRLPRAGPCPTPHVRSSPTTARFAPNSASTCRSEYLGAQRQRLRRREPGIPFEKPAMMTRPAGSPHVQSGGDCNYRRVFLLYPLATAHYTGAQPVVLVISTTAPKTREDMSWTRNTGTAMVTSMHAVAAPRSAGGIS